MELTTLTPDDLTDTFRAILAGRLTAALRDAPEIIELARAQRVPHTGVGGDGVEAPLPMHEVPVDDSDATYAGLVAWAWHFAEELNIPAPVSAAAGWHIANGQMQGFTAATTSREAKVLARVVVGWLVLHQAAIAERSDFLDYAQAVLPELHRQRGRYPISSRREQRGDRAEVCPICGARAVIADWYDPTDPTVSRLLCAGDLNGCGSETETLLAAAGRQRTKLERLVSLELAIGDFAAPFDAEDPTHMEMWMSQIESGDLVRVVNDESAFAGWMGRVAGFKGSGSGRWVIVELPQDPEGTLFRVTELTRIRRREEPHGLSEKELEMSTRRSSGSGS